MEGFDVLDNLKLDLEHKTGYCCQNVIKNPLISAYVCMYPLRLATISLRARKPETYDIG